MELCNACETMYSKKRFRNGVCDKCDSYFRRTKKQFKNTEYSIKYIKSEVLCKKELKCHTKNPKCKLPCRYYYINQIKASYKSQQKPQKKIRQKNLYKVIEG